ncbi:MAG: cation:dicarboxylase symporter family transporter [Eubacterium sp.]|nr:cation:dicarboxylase symporter family transporter [Eubacterium sp.]
MRNTQNFTADLNGVGGAVDFVREFLSGYGIKGKDFIRAVLTAEEAIGSLVERAKPDSEFKVYAKALFGTVTIEIVSDGEEFDLSRNIAEASPDGLEDVGNDTGIAIRGILLKAYTNNLKYNHKAGVNSVRMTVVRSKKALLYQTLAALGLAIIVGFILSNFGSESLNGGLDKYVFVPIKTMFMSALKMVVAPVVFFSIITCISQFGSLSDMGRIGGKVLGFYLMTTVIAVGVGLGAYYLFQPGGGIDIGQAVDATKITSQTMDVSILDTIVNIVPVNVVKPFLEADMLQLIFLAVIAGIAVGMLGKYSRVLKDLIEACNELFLKITNIIIKFMPLAVFCSISSMMLSLGGKTMLSVLGMLGTFVFGLVCMMSIYCLLMLLFGRMNPLPFVKKYAPTMLQVFSLASSNASIPVNMDAAEKKLGISKRVYSLSIPLGATMNMDGTCVHLGVFALALAATYGVEIKGSTILSMVISIIVLSVGAPGIPGSGLICLSVLLTQIGVPVEAIGLVMGIDPIVGMFRTMSNCLGDMVATTVVAKSEGLIDMEKYKGKLNS